MGADATGKSNVVSVLNFLKDIAESGLDNAISMQGGIETLGNMRVGTSDLRIKIDLSVSQKVVPYRLVLRRKQKGERRRNGFLAEVKLLRYMYGFTIAFGKKRRFRIVEEHLEVRFEITKNTSRSSRHALLQLQELTVKARRVERKFEITTIPDKFQVDSSDIIPKFLSKRRETQNSQRHLVIEKHFSYIPSILTESLCNIAVFDSLSSQTAT
jgi:predicted ATPase